MEKNLAAWSFGNSVGYYVAERSRPEDLYDSERAMLLPVVPRIGSVLDVGCAVGNFRNVFRALDPKIEYSGIDAAEGMITEARRRHPGVDFRVNDGRTLPYPDGAFDLVLCTGVLNHNPDWIEMVSEMFRVSRRYCVIDLPRLVTVPYRFDLDASHMVLKNRFPDGAGALAAADTRVPYVLANVREAFGGMLDRFAGNLSGLACKGYFGKTDASVVIPTREVIFAVILLAKGSEGLRCAFTLPPEALALAEGEVHARRAAIVGSVTEIL